MTASPVAAATVSFNPESRLYIDGQLRDSSSGRTADNINPATEEVLGTCTDAGADDMDEAIAAARRAFDTTDWSTNHEFRQRCLMQLHEALQEEKEEMRAELIAEVGAPVGMTYIAQLEWPLADAVRWPAEYISKFAWERDARRGRQDGRALQPRRGQGADGRRRRDHARGTSRSRSSATRWARSWPPATRWCSSRPSRPRGARCAGAGSSPRRPTSPPVW